MARRDVLARYRGSFGDVFWTVLNPLLLMGTYFFVFGIVLQTRFGPDASRTGFALYFLAGMLPWLAFSEPVGRSPHVIWEHRNFVKKLVFPAGDPARCAGGFGLHHRGVRDGGLHGGAGRARRTRFRSACCGCRRW